MTLILERNQPEGNSEWKTAGIHFVAWILFISYELLTIYFISGTWGSLADDLFFYCLHIGLFYFHARVVLPVSFAREQEKYALGVVLLILEMAIYLTLKYFLSYHIDHLRLSFNEPLRVRTYFVSSAWRGIYFLGFSSVYWLLKRLFDYRAAIGQAERQQLLILRQKADIERNLAEVRNAHLQQQINPHFLFNTLNFVYRTVYKQSQVASDCILQLTDMMRYSLRSYDQDAKSTLAQEIEQILNLVAINRMRFDYELYIDLNLGGGDSDREILPLVFLTFTENVFKHGYLKDPDHPARVEISLDEATGLLKFGTWNLKKHQPPQQKMKSIGVANARKRLDYAYSKNYGLEINDSQNAYGLELWIKL